MSSPPTASAYLVSCGEYSDYRVCCVCLDRAVADAVVERLNRLERRRDVDEVAEYHAALERSGIADDLEARLVRAREGEGPYRVEPHVVMTDPTQAQAAVVYTVWVDECGREEDMGQVRTRWPAHPDAEDDEDADEDVDEDVLHGPYAMPAGPDGRPQPRMIVAVSCRGRDVALKAARDRWTRVKAEEAGVA